MHISIATRRKLARLAERASASDSSSFMDASLTLSFCFRSLSSAACCSRWSRSRAFSASRLPIMVLSSLLDSFAAVCRLVGVEAVLEIECPAPRPPPATLVDNRERLGAHRRAVYSPVASRIMRVINMRCDPEGLCSEGIRSQLLSE